VLRRYGVTDLNIAKFKVVSTQRAEEGTDVFPNWLKMKLISRLKEYIRVMQGLRGEEAGYREV